LDLDDADRVLVIDAIEVGSLEDARRVIEQLKERSQ
jgi:septum formation inhibitor-activating ATPase MinD